MVALVTKTQTYQVLRSGRRGHDCPGYKDTDLPVPAIWQKGPWLPWLQRHRRTRSCDLAERGHGCLGYKDTDLPGPAIWQKGPWLPWVQEQTLPSVYQRRTQAPCRPQALAAKLHMLLITVSRLTAGTSQQQFVNNTASQQHSLSTTQPVNNTARSTTQPVNNTAESTTQPVNNTACQAANNTTCQQHSLSTTQPGQQHSQVNNTGSQQHNTVNNTVRSTTQAVNNTTQSTTQSGQQHSPD